MVVELAELKLFAVAVAPAAGEAVAGLQVAVGGRVLALGVRRARLLHVAAEASVGVALAGVAAVVGCRAAPLRADAQGRCRVQLVAVVRLGAVGVRGAALVLTFAFAPTVVVAVAACPYGQDRQPEHERQHLGERLKPHHRFLPSVTKAALTRPGRTAGSAAGSSLPIDAERPRCAPAFRTRRTTPVAASRGPPGARSQRTHWPRAVSQRRPMCIQSSMLAQGTTHCPGFCSIRSE